MKKLCIAAMTGDQQAKWPTATLELGPFVLGRGWTGPSYPYTTLPDGTVVFKGHAAMGVLREHDYVVLQHWPGEGIVDELQACGKKVGFWLNLLSVQTTPYWNFVQEPIRQVLMQFAMTGTDGKQVVTWPGAVAVDMMKRDLALAVCGALQYVMDTSYTRARPDFFFVDELTDEWYCTAPNKPEVRPEDWRGWVGEVLGAIAGMHAPVWGHNTYMKFPGVRRVVHEHATRRCGTLESWLGRVELMTLARPQATQTTSMVGLGWEKRDDIPAEWCRELRDREYEFMGQLVLQTARTGKSFQIFDPFVEG